MERASLGKTGLVVSRIGFGGWAAGGHSWGRVDDGETAAAVRAALAEGIDLFDTADVYGFGHSERTIGSALGEARERVTLVSKFGVAWDEQGRTRKDLSPERMERALAASLERLGVERIPLYVMHWPDGRTPIADTMEALERARARGRIGHVGCSNFPVELLDEAQRHGRVDVVQVPFNVLRQDEARPLLEAARRHSMGVLAFDALAKGLLSAKFSPEDAFGPDDVRARDPAFQPPQFEANLAVARGLAQVGRAHGKSAASVALRWVLDTPGVDAVIVGMKRPAQVQENLTALGWKLSDADHALVSRLARGTKDR